MGVYNDYVKKLNDDDLSIRLSSLVDLLNFINDRKIEKPIRADHYVNNHIHTFYSFSPYSPTMAVWMAYKAGLSTAGIMDHDSISGAREFIVAGKILDIATTIGVECRADFSNTPLGGKRLNNPDQKSIAYVAIHGIPHNQIDVVKDYFTAIGKYRNERNKLMVQRINNILKSHNLRLDFEQDVMPLSKANEGGSITERHILFALSQKIVDLYGRGEALISFLKNGIHIDVSPRNEQYLLDQENEFYIYDLLGVLKSNLVEKFYVPATKECPDVRDIVKFTKEINAIPAYAYLGDIEDSVTGDKKSQKFEDDYLELLFEVLKDYGFCAVTYMPSRNTSYQLRRVRNLCIKHGLFQISGEDINSPRQSFVCETLKSEEFSHLVDSTWALIGHERAGTLNGNNNMFSESIKDKYPDLDKRINFYKNIGKGENI